MERTSWPCPSSVPALPVTLSVGDPGGTRRPGKQEGSGPLRHCWASWRPEDTGLCQVMLRWHRPSSEDWCPPPTLREGKSDHPMQHL